MNKVFELSEIAKKIRSKTVELAFNSKSAHVGSALSCVDILVALFYNKMNGADRFILSKGHACMSYYCVLDDKGYLPKGLLETYSKNGSILSEHPEPWNVPRIDVGTGSLGHGLSIAVGAALARKIKDEFGREFVLLGDGECNEGSVWEAAMVAANMKLDNLVVIIDHNKLQAAGFQDRSYMFQKWESFGWNVHEIIGNFMGEIVNALDDIKEDSGKPTVIVAHTVKGKGVSFMENNLEWHYRHPNSDEYLLALKEINGK